MTSRQSISSLESAGGGFGGGAASGAGGGALARVGAGAGAGAGARPVSTDGRRKALARMLRRGNADLSSDELVSPDELTEAIRQKREQLDAIEASRSKLFDGLETGLQKTTRDLQQFKTDNDQLFQRIMRLNKEIEHEYERLSREIDVIEGEALPSAFERPEPPQGMLNVSPSHLARSRTSSQDVSDGGERQRVSSVPSYASGGSLSAMRSGASARR